MNHHEVVYTDYNQMGGEWIDQRLANFIRLYPQIKENFVLVTTQAGEVSITRHAVPLPGGSPDGVEIKTSGEVEHCSVSYAAVTENRHFTRWGELVTWDDGWTFWARTALQHLVAKVLPTQRICLMRLPPVWAATVIQETSPVSLYTFQIEYIPIWKIKTTEFIDRNGGERFQLDHEDHWGLE